MYTCFPDERLSFAVANQVEQSMNCARLQIVKGIESTNALSHLHFFEMMFSQAALPQTIGILSECSKNARLSSVESRCVKKSTKYFIKYNNTLQSFTALRWRRQAFNYVSHKNFFSGSSEKFHTFYDELVFRLYSKIVKDVLNEEDLRYSSFWNFRNMDQSFNLANIYTTFEGCDAGARAILEHVPTFFKYPKRSQPKFLLYIANFAVRLLTNIGISHPKAYISISDIIENWKDYAGITIDPLRYKSCPINVIQNRKRQKKLLPSKSRVRFANNVVFIQQDPDCLSRKHRKVRYVELIDFDSPAIYQNMDFSMVNISVNTLFEKEQNFKLVYLASVHPIDSDQNNANYLNQKTPTETLFQLSIELKASEHRGPKIDVILEQYIAFQRLFLLGIH